MTTTRRRRRSTRKRTKRKTVREEAIEFVEQLQRLEREHIPILPDHPKPH